MTPRNRIVVAALLSLALHGLVVSGSWIPLPRPDVEAPQVLTARLVPPPRLAPPPPKPKPRVSTPRRTAPPPLPDVARVAAASPLVLPDPVPDAAPAPEVVEAAPAPEPPDQLALAPETSAAAARTLPRRGRITYSLYYGEDRTYVGKVVQTWEIENDSYMISSDAETAGIVELFRPQRLRYMSQGHVMREGLRPDSFLMSRTRRGRHEAAQARFHWDASRLDYGLAREPKSATLAPGTQDFLSFIFQYALLPPQPGRYQVPITTGSSLRLETVEVGNEEAIETPLGVMQALPVRQLPRPGAESIQIWLASEYRYLPVRIRHYDREGHYSGEQEVNEIRISDE